MIIKFESTLTYVDGVKELIVSNVSFNENYPKDKNNYILGMNQFDYLCCNDNIYDIIDLEYVYEKDIVPLDVDEDVICNFDYINKPITIYCTICDEDISKLKDWVVNCCKMVLI